MTPLSAQPVCHYLRGLALALALLVLCTGLAHATEPVSADAPPSSPLGLHAAYLQESGEELSVAEADAAYRAGKFVAGDAPVLDFGIGAQPHWLALTLDNRTSAAVQRRLAVETAWLDHLDIYLLTADRVVASYQLGDARPYAMRPIDHRFFVIEHGLAPGASLVLMRVATTDPMVVPIYLRTPEAAAAEDRRQGYSYGFVYGFLLALLAYNAMLYIGLRSSRYLYYAIYLSTFLLMNIAYTGHGFAWLWPGQPGLQLWVIPFLIMAYGLSGLLFASSFLDTSRRFPALHRLIVRGCVAFGVLELVLFALGASVAHMVVAFVFAALFSVMMLWLGIAAIRAGYRPAWYFLMGASAAMTGALLTDLSVASLIPFNVFTYRAIELGMLVDAVMLALALAHQFRVNQQEKFLAERIARLDPLTGLNNRRAFYEITDPFWNAALRNDRQASLMLFDIDNFKRINDTYGHAAGDEVLVAVADDIRQTARKSDVAARWGGEEFILFLPDASLADAAALAERLRARIAARCFHHAAGEFAVTASFGVVERSRSSVSIEELTSQADKRLYQAKNGGRNRVSVSAAA